MESLGKIGCMFLGEAWMNRQVLIAFDFDGVLADTISMLKGTFKEFVESYKLCFSDELFAKYDGVSLEKIISELKEQYNIEENTVDLLKNYEQRINHNMVNIKPVNGSEYVLEALKAKGYKMVVSSSAPRNYIKDFLTNNCLIGYFDKIFSGESCVYSKPDCRYYTKIKESYNDYEIFVVEDSENGITAAFNAGLKTIWFRGNKSISVPYHYEIDSLIQVPDVIDKKSKIGYFVSNNDINIVIRNSSQCFTTKEIARIEAAWRKRPQNVFNGKVLACRSYSYKEKKIMLDCYFTEYKYVYSMRDKITPVAVSGICIDTDNCTIIAVRNKVSDCIGKYELVPSGGIEKRIVENVKKGHKNQILVEMCEETGGALSTENVISVDDLGICYDAQNNTMDICMMIKYNDSFKQVTFGGLDSEYTSETFMIEQIDVIKAFLKEKEAVVTSVMILDKIC